MVAGVWVCRMEGVVYRGVEFWRRGRCSARRDAFALAHACRALHVNVGNLGSKVSACTVFIRKIGPKLCPGQRHRLPGEEERGREGSKQKNDYSQVLWSSTPHPHAHNRPKQRIETPLSESSLNGRAGGLPRRVVAVLLSVVRAGEGTCEGHREGPESVGNGGGWDV